MICGQTLRLLRAIKGIKQKTIAKKLGISQPAYSKLEKCEAVNGERADAILAALNCTQEDVENFEKAFIPPPKKSRINFLPQEREFPTRFHCRL